MLSHLLKIPKNRTVIAKFISVISPLDPTDAERIPVLFSVRDELFCLLAAVGEVSLDRDAKWGTWRQLSRERRERFKQFKLSVAILVHLSIKFQRHADRMRLLPKLRGPLERE